MEGGRGVGGHLASGGRRLLISLGMAGRSLDDLVQDLGVRHRSKAAQRELMRRGPGATRALQRGLSDPNPAVRVGCCVVLDHRLDASASPDLLANVAQEDAAVRRWAMHALTCDRCKEGECRPGEDDTIPLAIQMLTDDVDYQVRTAAVHALGPSVHTRDDVVHVLQPPHAQDPHPLVRKVAGWFIPGGPIYGRTQPRPARSYGESSSVGEERLASGSMIE